VQLCSACAFLAATSTVLGLSDPKLLLFAYLWLSSTCASTLGLLLTWLLAFLPARFASADGASAAVVPTQQQQQPAGTAAPSSSSSAATACRAVQLIELLVRHQPDWLPACPAVFNALWQQWKLVGAQRVSCCCCMSVMHLCIIY
jgi:hypothetical protein